MSAGWAQRCRACARATPALLLALLAPLSALLAPLPGRAQGDTRAEEPPPVLRAGFAVEPLPTPEGAPLAGYGGLRDRRAEGVLDPPEASALLLEQGELRVALLVLDIVIVRPELREALLREAEPLELDGLAVLASHTHSGPGGYVRGWLAERITAGSFTAGALEGLVQSGGSALRAAADGLAPARLSAIEGRAALARNRRREDGSREVELPIFQLSLDTGARILGFSYGMHPTALSPANLRYSADYLASARAALRERGWLPLFLPGAMGDQGPPHLEKGRGEDTGPSESERAESLGRALADQVQRDARNLEPGPPPRLDWVEQSYAPPDFTLRRFCALWWLSPLVGRSARRLISERAPLQALALGELRIALVPAELSSALGGAIRSGLRERRPGTLPIVLVHANDWLGYAVTPETYARGGYEACLTLHGPESGARLVAASLDLLDALSGVRAQPR